MYKKDQNRQFTLQDFNQPIGLKMNPENRWIKKADLIPWDEIEQRYAQLFPSHTGMPAKPLRAALGSLIIQKQYNFSDRELVQQITENPYYQYFIGLHGYQQEPPYAPSLLVEFRKRLTDEILGQINELIINNNLSYDTDKENCSKDDEKSKNNDHVKDDNSPKNDDNTKENDKPKNDGTLIIDATCAPQNIAYPQDINLLNEARESLENMIDKICYEYNHAKPRTYRKKARKDYLSIAKKRKKSKKSIRKAIKKQLQYVRRNIGYIEIYIKQGKKLSFKDTKKFEVIKKIYQQQLYMYENKTHTVTDRIVSISQPYIRPIVRGKAKTPTEFGTKLDLSIDEKGMARLEKQSFNAYNESEVLIGAAENYKQRTGNYPKRILADKIYRNRKNIGYCKERGIRLTGPLLGRPKKEQLFDKKQEYQDAIDRIEIERRFSQAKRCFGLGLIKTKLEETTKSSIALSIIAMNLERLRAFSFVKFFESIFQNKIVYIFRFLKTIFYTKSMSAFKYNLMSRH